MHTSICLPACLPARRFFCPRKKGHFFLSFKRFFTHPLTRRRAYGTVRYTWDYIALLPLLLLLLLSTGFLRNGCNSAVCVLLTFLSFISHHGRKEEKYGIPHGSPTFNPLSIFFFFSSIKIPPHGTALGKGRSWDCGFFLYNLLVGVLEVACCSALLCFCLFLGCFWAVLLLHTYIHGAYLLRSVVQCGVGSACFRLHSWL